MKILALDTSTEFLSLALQLDDNIFTHHQLAGNASSELILPQIQALLDSANIKLSDLDGIAFGAGPGAFTGVRVACGVAQGLGFGANIPVVGVNTLLAVAQASGADKVIVCLDARMGEIYHAMFEKNIANKNAENTWQETCETKVCKPEASPILAYRASIKNAHEKQHEKNWVGAGSGWAIYGDILREIYAENLADVNAEVTPTAEAILQLAKPIFAAGKAKPASEAAPIYIRNRVALTTLEREAGQRL
jgi:tRNA threonylcarbamoyladenosine biosynthesis protein TsaB